jgi:hypothetical protein
MNRREPLVRVLWLGLRNGGLFGHKVAAKQPVTQQITLRQFTWNRPG